MARERTLVILKPDAIEREIVSQIIEYFMRAGLKIIQWRKMSATEEHLDKHFPNTKQWILNMGLRACQRAREEFEVEPIEQFGTNDAHEIGQIIARGCRGYYLSGELIPLVLEGENAVSVVRKIIGKTMPSKAEKGTIRGDWGEEEDPNSIAATRNLVHASDSVEEAEREIAAWFTPEEIVSM